jgi:hypothetical protein
MCNVNYFRACESRLASSNREVGLTNSFRSNAGYIQTSDLSLPYLPSKIPLLLKNIGSGNVSAIASNASCIVLPVLLYVLSGSLRLTLYLVWGILRLVSL